MTSFASVPAGRLMLSDVALLAVPLLLVAAPRNPMMNAPGQVSATSHSLAAGRHTVPPLPGGCWQLLLVPSQVSAVQGSPSSGHAAPAFPTGCVHVVLAPLHSSAVQGLPSSVQAVPFALIPSLGQVVLLPVQDVPLAFLTSAGQVELVPVQLSARSHSAAAARQTAPALPTGCWQSTLVPLHWSRVQALPSSVQAVPLAFRGPSAGHVALEPVQVSGRSHSPAAARQVFVLLAKVQLFLQHEPAAPFNALPRSQSSPDSTVPLPQVPGASVNVVSAVWPEERPAAVRVNVTPRSKTSTVKSVFVKSPFESATDVSARSGSNGGSSCRTMSTVSPGSQPLAVMVTVCPG